jgi:FlaA1/EpsC-like NDP-sugar epimerase
MNNISEYHGGIMSLKMKSAQIEDLLKVWSKYYGIPYEKIGERPGDKLDEVLIGKIELPHVKSVEIDGKEYYYINFYKKFENDLTDEVSSANAERLSEKEMFELITTKPQL